MLFSERLGFKKVEDIILVDRLSETLKNSLANVIYDIFQESHKIHSEYDYRKTGSWKIYYFLIKEFFKGQINNSLDCGYGFTVYYEEIIDRLDNMEWYAYFDLLETLAKMKIIDIRKRKSINNILESENSGYRLSESNEFIPITDDVAIKNIDAASESTFECAKNHIQKSLTYISDKQNQDYNNVVREAISAVESCIIEISGLPATKKNTLGTAVKAIRDNPNIEIDLTFLKPFETMYGLASNNGIRHAGNEKAIVSDLPDAILVLTTCSALINYLGIKLLNNPPK